ncbi:MAG: aldehyde dehydrogenase family protein, partial [Myxococcota bacterium]|nr:aldehyde dehydrogenase family protein [Myxococcota bacterium]
MTAQAQATAAAARQAQRSLGSADASLRTAVLERLAVLIQERQDDLLEANARDVQAATEAGLAPALLDRLKLSSAKLATLLQGARSLAAQPDPLGRVLRRTELDDGLELTQVTSPLGVLLIIFESRPDAVIQIGSLALRSGNAVLLKGGSEARHSNTALVACLRDALSDQGLAPDAVTLVEGREAVAGLLEQDAL